MRIAVVHPYPVHENAVGGVGILFDYQSTPNPAAVPTAAKIGKQHGAAIAAMRAPTDPTRSRETMLTICLIAASFRYWLEDSQLECCSLGLESREESPGAGVADDVVTSNVVMPA